MRPSILRAYRETRYEAGGIAVQIGRRSAAMDALLTSFGVREAAFITAYNPRSRRMPFGWNQRMQGRLAQTVRRCPSLTGVGHWRGWAEAHLLVFDDARKAKRQARRFRQNGIVIVRIRQLAYLIIT